MEYCTIKLLKDIRTLKVNVWHTEYNMCLNKNETAMHKDISSSRKQEHNTELKCLQEEYEKLYKIRNEKHVREVREHRKSIGQVKRL